MKVLPILGVVILVSGIALTQSQALFFWRTGLHGANLTNISGDFDPTETLAYVNGQSLAVPANEPNDQTIASVLAETTPKQKRIEVDLTNQRLYAIENDKTIYDFPISSGKISTPTPTGEFKPWIKLRYKTMKGGSKIKGDYYYLPNVPYVMFFYNKATPKWEGYAIHGAYWHFNFGKPISHGCVNLRIPDAKVLYYWTDPPVAVNKSLSITNPNTATTIKIYGETPNQ